MKLKSLIQEAENLPFDEKLNFILALFEDREIDEAEGYQIFTAHGEPKPQTRPETTRAIVDFLDD